MVEAPAAIEVRDLRKVYGYKAAVDGLSLTVPAGSFFGFLGPNGAGKTTTIRMLTGLAPPTSGSIRLLGLSMPEQAMAIKRQIGLVPDGSSRTGAGIGFTVRARGELEPVDRRLFARDAEARGDGSGTHPPAAPVPDG